MFGKIIELYNHILGLYSELRCCINKVDYISYIFQIITIIITIITFLTVMMSVEYQESVFKAREILFEIQNLKDFEEINKKIKKLEYIEFEKKRYKKVLQLFKLTTVLVSLITIVLSPIFFINKFIVLIISISIILMLFVIIKINIIFYNGLNNSSLEYVLNAKYFEKNYSTDIVVFPNIVFNSNNFLILDSPIPIKNYVLAMQMELEDFKYILMMYKRNSDEIEDNEPPNIKIKEIDLEKITSRDISYYIKVENRWICFDIKIERESDKIIIIPKCKKKSETVSNPLLEMEKNSIENQIIVK